MDHELLLQHGPRLGAYGLAVYLSLAHYANSKTQRCFPSIKTIANQIKVSPRQVGESLSLLCEIGLIEKNGKNGARNTYTLLHIAQQKGRKPHATDAQCAEVDEGEGETDAQCADPDAQCAEVGDKTDAQCASEQEEALNKKYEQEVPPCPSPQNAEPGRAGGVEDREPPASSSPDGKAAKPKKARSQRGTGKFVVISSWERGDPLPDYVELKHQAWWESFTDWYKRYPHKVSGEDAWQAWKSIKLKDDSPELEREINDGLTWWIRFRWPSTELRKIPYPATWLNNRHWFAAREANAKPKQRTQHAESKPKDLKDDQEYRRIVARWEAL